MLTFKLNIQKLNSSVEAGQGAGQAHGQPLPPLREARRTSSLSSSCRAPLAQVALASGTTVLPPRYTSNRARHIPGESILRSGSACRWANQVATIEGKVLAGLSLLW